MWNRKFWMDLTERVVASAAGGALAVLIGGETTGDGSVGWRAVLIGAGVAAAVSFLKGLTAGQIGDRESASLIQ